MNSLWQLFSSPKKTKEIIEIPEPKQEEEEPELTPIEQLYATVNEIYKLIAEDKFEMAILIHKKYLNLKKELEMKVGEDNLLRDQIQIGQEMFQKATEKFSAVIKSKIIDSIEKNMLDEQIR